MQLLTLNIDIEFSGEMDKKQLNELRQWVQAWNQQYVSTVEKIPAQYLAQAVNLQHSPA